MPATNHSPPATLNFITSNANKLAEVRAILEGTSITLTSQNVPDLLEIQADTPEDVTHDKCVRAARAVKAPVLVEDTCLVFEAWGDSLPGPYIKYFLNHLHGPSNLHKLLAGWPDNKRATALCTFGYCEGPNEQGKEPEVLLFQGRTKGLIVPARGPQNFGWDAAFEPLEQPSPIASEDGQKKTYAEMRGEEKNSISHRGKALVELRRWLKGPEGN